MNRIKKLVLSKLISSPVVMLLERMEEKPEEFDITGTGLDLKTNYPVSTGYTRWNNVLNTGEFSWLEKKMLRQHLHAINRTRTQERILTESIAPQEQSGVEAYTAGTYAAGLAKAMNASTQTVAANIYKKAYKVSKTTGNIVPDEADKPKR